MISPDLEREVCPACGGAGGGPFGRANSGWDVESYECIRCEGWGYIRGAAVEDEGPPVVARPGIAKVPAERVGSETAKPKKGRRASG
ncbi:MAG: hypothetical protein ACLQBL_40125 [Polyangiaceae bacterium]